MSEHLFSLEDVRNYLLDIDGDHYYDPDADAVFVSAVEGSTGSEAVTIDLKLTDEETGVVERFMIEIRRDEPDVDPTAVLAQDGHVEDADDFPLGPACNVDGDDCEACQ